MTDWIKQLKTLQPAPLLPPQYQASNAYTFQLSEPSEFDHIDPLDTEAMIEHTRYLLQQHNALWAIGGYGEQRNLYQHDQYSGNNVIHLGLDCSLPAGTPLFAPIEAHVHSFFDNAQAGDYGPTLILQHQINDITFYSLYGHLSRDSLRQYRIDQPFAAGELIGQVGTADENGGWPTHLHLQLIRDIGDYQGNYPGVCELDQKDFFLNNCPNPQYILHFAPQPSAS